MGILSSLAGGADIAVDLGTANTLVFERGRGIVVSEPSVVAIDERDGSVQAVGNEAKRMIGRTPASISAIRPLRHGVIADFEVTERMLRHFMGKVHSGRFSHPRVVMCAPSGITDVEERALEEACLAAGAREMHKIEEPIAAAIGAGLAIEEPLGQMVVDVGGGTSEVAVISLGGIVVSESARTGGYELDDAIGSYVQRRYGFSLGEETAEEVKHRVGCATQLEEKLAIEIRGREIVSGNPKRVDLASDEVLDAIEPPLEKILRAVHETLERTPPELAADIAERGILLAGGGALLRGFDRRLTEETRMPVTVADSALTCVASGAGAYLEELDGSASATIKSS